MSKPRYTVVVADDEELLLYNLVEKIENSGLGFEVVGTAQTGTQALKLVNDFNPDLLITDIRMPAMDGITLLEKVRAKYPLIHFIIVSGFSDFEYAQSAIHMQVSEYLLKPIDPEKLRDALREVIHRLSASQYSEEAIFNQELGSQSPEYIVERLHDYLIQNYTMDINLSIIANNMHYSPSYLSKIFFGMYNMTPSKFITSLRIQRAKQLLVQKPGLSIKQVGEMVGYPEQGYFSRIFKKQTGISPYNFRDKT